MESDPHPWIAALRHSHDRLASLVQPLSPDELRARSYCTDWSIAQVLSHLGSGAEIALLNLNAGLEGTDQPGREAYQAIWDRWNAKSPDEQAADALTYDERHVERLEGLTDEQLANLHLSMFGMELDAAQIIGLRLGEHAVHTWDVAVALDPMAQVASDAVALLIDRVPLLAGRLGKPQGRELRLRIHTSGPERDFFLQVGDGVELTPWSDQPVDGELRLPAEALLRLVYGRLDPQHTPSVELTGEGVTLDDLRAVFPGF